jgi:hypothetical protein
LRSQGKTTLAGTKYWWLTNPERMDALRWRRFRLLRESALKTARAWVIKELAASLWVYRRRGWAARAWTAWLGWALRCRLAPMRKVTETLRKYIWGILNAIESRTTNALSEGMNSRIQALKQRACDCRNRTRFRKSHLLPSGRSRSLSSRHGHPHNSLKRQLTESPINRGRFRPSLTSTRNTDFLQDVGLVALVSHPSFHDVPQAEQPECERDSLYVTEPPGDA